MSWLVRLYPKRWRDRYGAELSALIEDTGGGWQSRADVVAAGLRMHFTHWSAARLIVACGLIGAAVGGVLMVTRPTRYVSEAVMTSPGGSHDALLIFQQTLSRKNLSEVIRKHDLYPAERNRMPMEDVIEKMRRDVTIRKQEDTSLVTVQYASPNRDSAAAVANELALASQTDSFKIIKSPTVPVFGNDTARRMLVPAGLCAGLIGGAFFALVRRRPARTLAWMATGGLAGCVVGFGIALVIPMRFISTAVVRIPAADKALIPGLAGKQVEVMELGANPDHVVLSISFQAPDRREAQRVVSDVTASLVRAEAQSEIIDPPTLPQKAIFPNRFSATLTGMISGLFAACIIIFARNRNPIQRTGTC